MSYKIKSLLYFVCFVASAVMYYTMEPETNNENKKSAEITELQSDNLDFDHKLAKLEKIQE
ncbi:MAG: hypothetical protein R3294_01135 [Arenibacter troitsensis]|nr:hypothetical protein [Arenibacter troitsensis]